MRQHVRMPAEEPDSTPDSEQPALHPQTPTTDDEPPPASAPADPRGTGKSERATQILAEATAALQAWHERQSPLIDTRLGARPAGTGKDTPSLATLPDVTAANVAELTREAFTRRRELVGLLLEPDADLVGLRNELVEQDALLGKLMDRWMSVDPRTAVTELAAEFRGAAEQHGSLPRHTPEAFRAGTLAEAARHLTTAADLLPRKKRETRDGEDAETQDVATAPETELSEYRLAQPPRIALPDHPRDQAQLHIDSIPIAAALAVGDYYHMLHKTAEAFRDQAQLVEAALSNIGVATPPAQENADRRSAVFRAVGDANSAVLSGVVAALAVDPKAQLTAKDASTKVFYEDARRRAAPREGGAPWPEIRSGAVSGSVPTVTRYTENLLARIKGGAA